MTKKSDNQNYNLKSDAVETLVNADTEQTPEYSEEELHRYRSRSGIHLPEVLKIILIKAWFFGAVCYFILWGLGVYVSNMIDMMFVLGIVMGIVTDLLLNNVLRFIEKTPRANEKWIFITKKGTIGFFLNILYGFVILFSVFMLYNVINYVINLLFTGDMTAVPLGVEPFFFGIFAMGFDMLFIGMKHFVSNMILDAKYADQIRRENQEKKQ